MRHKEWWLIYGPLLLLIAFGFLVAAQYIKPAPPHKIKLAAGEIGGAYDVFAQQYRQLLQKNGIELEIIHTHGSVQNLELMRAGQVDLALIQGGVAEQQDRFSGQIQGLGSLYFEPLWLFYRAELDIDKLSQLKGTKIAIGPQGSGTQALTHLLLGDNQLLERAQLLSLDSAIAAQHLLAGQIDAAFFVSSQESPIIKRLLRADKIKLASFKRAEAYVRRYPFLVKLTLPEGAEDLATNIPNRPVQLLATTTALVVRTDLHPAIISLMMTIIHQVHGHKTWFGAEGEFPTPDYLEFPLNAQAQNYYEHGPSFLQKYLPFWAASLIDRMKIMLLPLIGLLIPLFKILPPLYRWRMRARVYRWYEALIAIDQAYAQNPDRADELLRELDILENEVRDIRVPLSFSQQLYDLRLHISLIRSKLQGGHVA